MKYTSSLLFLILVILGKSISAQDSNVQFNKYINAEFAGQIVGLTNISGVKEQMFSGYIGYKFTDNFSVGINNGLHQELVKKDSLFKESFFIGLGCNKLFQSKSDKGLNAEIYLRFCLATEQKNNNSFNFYDVGVKAIPIKCSNIFVGTGIRQNFYNYDRKSLFIWYCSFGIRF